MCKFFSLVSDGNGGIFYFDWDLRKRCMSGELKYNPDSHTSIADFHGFKGPMEDRLNKWEYNPLTEELTADQINVRNDRSAVMRKLKALDFRTIVEPLKIKCIFHPFRDRNRKRVTRKDIANLAALASAWNSVGNFVGNSMWASLGYSVWNSVWNSVGYSVWNSVGASVGDSVGNSVGNSVWAYVGSFFTWDAPYQFQSAVDLWAAGLVPSFDGTTWRLHGGEKGKVLWSGDAEALKRFEEERDD